MAVNRYMPVSSNLYIIQYARLHMRACVCVTVRTHSHHTRTNTHARATTTHDRNFLVVLVTVILTMGVEAYQLNIMFSKLVN